VSQSNIPHDDMTGIFHEKEEEKDERYEDEDDGFDSLFGEFSLADGQAREAVASNRAVAFSATAAGC